MIKVSYYTKKSLISKNKSGSIELLRNNSDSLKNEAIYFNGSALNNIMNAQAPRAGDTLLNYCIGLMWK